MNSIKKTLRSNSSRWALFLILLAIVSGWMGSTTYTRFDGIKLSQNPAIVFKNAQDSMSSRTAGTINIYSTVTAKSFIGDTSETALNVYQVSSAFKNSTFRKLSSTIQGAIDNMDSGTIYVAPGVYDEKITLKSKITIIGAGTNRTTITRANDSCIVYGIGVSNVTLKDISIVGTQTTKDTSTCIKLIKNFVDTTSLPSIVFDNVSIKNTYTSGAGLCTYGIIADSSSFIMKNSYMNVTGKSGSSDDRGSIKAKRSCKITLLNNSIICKSGESVDRVLWLYDVRCRFTLGYNQFMITTGAVFSETVTATGRFYNNVSNVDITGGGLVNLIGSANNITDADILLQ